MILYSFSCLFICWWC